jgi:hypothetical protein
MGERETTLSDRITFAEDWLDQARRRIQDGQTVHGTLALMLAEAELHRAREADIAAGARPIGRPWAAWTALGALSLAAVVVIVSFAVHHPPVLVFDSEDTVRPIVRLAAGTGEMLRIVTPPEPVVERTVVQSRIIHVRVPIAPIIRVEPVPRPVAAPRPAVPARPVAVPVTVVPQAPVQPAAAPPVAAPAPSLLTDAEVIDMVLAAERSLRQAGKQ